MSRPFPDPGEPDPDRPRPSPGDLPDDIPPGTDPVVGGLPDGWQEVFEQSEIGLRRFLSGKLRQTADVEDCLQALMIAVLNNRRNIPPAARRAWLFRVAANEAARWWRNKSTTDRVLERHAETRDEAQTDPPPLERQETLQRIDDAISQLPENYRQIVQLRLVDSMTFQSIADNLALPLGTVLTRMRRAMERLRTELNEPED